MYSKRVVLPKSPSSSRAPKQTPNIDPFSNMELNSKKPLVLKPLCLAHRNPPRSAPGQQRNPKKKVLKPLHKAPPAKKAGGIKLRPLTKPPLSKIVDTGNLCVSVSTSLGNSDELPVFPCRSAPVTQRPKKTFEMLKELFQNDNPNEISFGYDDNSVLERKNIFK